MRFPWSKPKRFAKQARVFAARTASKVLVVSQHYVGSAGAMLTDSDDVMVLEVGSDHSPLADAIVKALDSTRVLPDQNLRDSERSEWPAYRASGCRSMRQFEADYIEVRVSGANQANHFVWIEGWPEKGAELSVRCSANVGSPGLGIACMRVIDACRSRRI